MATGLSRVIQAMPPSEIRKIFTAAGSMSDVMHLEIGDPDFPTPPHIVDAAHRAARDGFTHYTATAGTIETREAIAAKLCRDNGISCDPSSEVIVTVGAVGAIMSACMAVLNPGDEAIVTEPNWPNYLAQIMMAGAKPVLLPLRESLGFAPDLDELRARITPRTRMIIVNSPNNPCGSVLSRETLIGIGEIALRNNLVVVCDEVYEKILYDGNTHFSLASLPEYRDNVLTVNALSKTYAMTGWRVGYAAGPATIISAMAKVLEASASCVSSVVQKAAVAALTGPQDVVSRMVEIYRRRRNMILEGLKEIPGIRTIAPGGAFYVFPNIACFGLKSFDFAMALLREARVAVVHGAGLGESGEGHVRIAFSAADDVIAEALRRIASWAENRRR
ncbi:MAG: pyridoxal phosphate-dependent aminotransferase [Bacillota bacterium]|jgi:aminotransferase